MGDWENSQTHGNIFLRYHTETQNIRKCLRWMKKKNMLKLRECERAVLRRKCIAVNANVEKYLKSVT